MARFKKYEHLPWWLNNLNDNTLTPTQKEVLDLDYYCKKHGTKLSHRGAAERLDRGRQTVYTARRRLEELLLRTTEPAKGSFKLGHPLEYPNEADWLTILRARGMSLGRSKMERKSSSKKKILKESSSSSKVAEASAAEARDSTSGGYPPNPPAVQGGASAKDTPDTSSAWTGRRETPRWKKYRHWGYGLRMNCAGAESYADHKFSQWLESQNDD